MAISFFTEGAAQMPEIKKTEIRNWVKQVAQMHNKRVGEVSYIFCDDEKILEVNRQYLQHDYYTDIITFDYTEGKKISGDIVISLDTVRSNAEDAGCTFQQELCRILIHGVLHLTGQDDKAPDTKAEMTRKEDLALASF